MAKRKNLTQSALDLKLGCQGFDVAVRVGDLPRISADFVLEIPPNETELIAEALKRLTEYLSGPIYLVRASGDEKRCFYCGTLADPSARKCDSCGAPY